MIYIPMYVIKILIVWFSIGIILYLVGRLSYRKTNFRWKYYKEFTAWGNAIIFWDVISGVALAICVFVLVIKWIAE